MTGWVSLIELAGALGAAASPALVPALVPAQPQALAPAATFAEAGALWAATADWIRQSYARAPVLMLGLAVLLVVPPLALLGLLVRRRRPAAHETQIVAGAPGRPADRGSDGGDGLTWPVDAWLEIEDRGGMRYPISRELLRVGRDDDNDLVLADTTVHRFHAVIQRTEDAEIVVVDMSGDDGNGVSVNGKRVSRARLKSGDRIELGEARLRFGARRV